MEEPTAYETIAECYRRGSASEAQPRQPTAHVAIENAIGVIIDLRDEVAKLRRTVAAQDGHVKELETRVKEADGRCQGAIEAFDMLKANYLARAEKAEAELARVREAMERALKAAHNPGPIIPPLVVEILKVALNEKAEIEEAE